MNQPRSLVLAIAAVMLLVFLAACGGDSDDSTTTTASSPTEVAATAVDQQDGQSTTTTEAGSSSDPAPTEEAETDVAEATETEANDDPTATSEESDEDPTATVAADGERLVGTAFVEDDSDDVANILMQEPDEPMPGIDLQSVRLEADGEQIVATITTAGDIGAELSDDLDVDFDVHIWQDGKPIYALSFHHYGSDDWIATVTDFTVGPLGDEETIDTEITVTDTSLSAAFPTSLLSELETPFEWYSSVMLYESGNLIGPDTWFDGAPENVIALLADPDQFVEFPQ